VSDQRLPDETASLPRVKIPRLSRSWRLDAAASVQDMHFLSRWFQAQNADPNSQKLVEAVDAQLDEVQYYLSRRFGINPTSILKYLQAAQAFLLRLAPLSYVRSSLPSLVVQARTALDADDPRLIKLVDLAGEAKLEEDARDVVIFCFEGASEEARRAEIRLNSFRNVIVATASSLFLLAFFLAVVGYRNPTLLPICFARNVNNQITMACPAGESDPFVDSLAAQELATTTPTTRTTRTTLTPPTPSIIPSAPIRDINNVIKDSVSSLDIPLVEFVGFIAAALAAALAIRKVRGSSDPYSIPLALAFLKLPAGALTAVLGLVLIRAGLVPGIDSLDSSAEIVAWALVFGYAQQLFTGVVDRQAESILEQSGASLSRTRSTGAPQQ
jgi:hypothetical protein